MNVGEDNLTQDDVTSLHTLRNVNANNDSAAHARENADYALIYHRSLDRVANMTLLQKFSTPHLSFVQDSFRDDKLNFIISHALRNSRASNSESTIRFIELSLSSQVSSLLALL